MGNNLCTTRNTQPPGPYVEAVLPGLVKKDWDLKEDKYLNMYVPSLRNFDRELFNKYKGNYSAFEQKPYKVKIHNARIEQEQAASPADFFKEHGFVLLENNTNVKDWNTDETRKDTDITNIYHAEIEDLIRNQLFPSAEYNKVKKLTQPGHVLRRGKGQPVSAYANGIHQDY